MDRTVNWFWSSDRGLSLLLLFLCGVIFVVVPMMEMRLLGRMTLAVVFSLILVSGASVVARGRVAFALVGALAAATIVVRWSSVALDVPWLVVLDALLSMLFTAALAAVVTAQVFREGPITGARIQGAVAVYLLLGMAWASAYEFVELSRPGSFTTVAATGDDPSFQFIYFSFVVLTTVGFGDIAPVDPIARSLASLEALVGQLFPAILLARLVSLEVLHKD